VLDVRSGQIKYELFHTHGVRFVCFSSNGRLASGGEGDIVTVWDIENGKKITEFHHQKPNFLTDGAHPSPKSRPVEVCTVSFSPCGSMMASGGTDNRVTVWDPTGSSKIVMAQPITEKVIAILRQTDPVTASDFSSDGKWFGCAGGTDSSGGYIRMYKIGEWHGCPTFENAGLELQSTDRVTVLEFSPDGLFFVHGGDGGVSFRIYWTLLHA
jgi:WD40 repeat protein